MPRGRILDYLMKKKAGKRTTDVSLPNEAGRDPRLPTPEDEQVNALTLRNRMFKELAGR